jgi:hypothetical protein
MTFPYNALSGRCLFSVRLILLISRSKEVADNPMLMTQTKALFVQVFLLGAIFSAVPVVSALAADEAGWGMKGSAGGPMAGQFRGDGERPPVPTVDNCVERTGKTETACQEMVERFEQGGRPTLQGGQGDDGQRKGSLDGQRPNASERPVLGKFFDALQNRMEKTISFLQSKDVDTDAIESAFVTLKEKIGVAKTAYETYQDALVAWKSDQTDGNKEALDTARTAAREAAQAVKTYYHESMLPLLKGALQSID